MATLGYATTRPPRADRGIARRSAAALGAWLLVVPTACSKPKRELDAGTAELVVLRTARARQLPPRDAIALDSGAGGYDRHPRRPGDDDGHGYGYEFTDTFLHDDCERFAACDVRSALASAERALYDCYDLVPGPGGKLVGDVTLRLEVSRRGGVDDSAVVHSTTGNADFDACVASALRSTAFGPSDDGDEGDTLLTLQLRVLKAKE